MSDTFPFAYGGLRELAGIWRTQLDQAATPAERDQRRARLTDLYLQIANTDPDPIARRDVADQLFALNEDEPLPAATLEKFAETCGEQGDTEAHRRALEILSRAGDAAVRTRALEQLGEVFEQLGNRRAAAESWRPAAKMREVAPGGQRRARRLYERVLDALPADREAAERLVRLYADGDEWEKIPEVLAVVLRADPERGSQVLLALEPRALDAGALDPFVAMVDEAVALRASSSDAVRDLRRAKAHALAQDPARRAEASLTFRGLLETIGSDEDRRDYQAFIDAGTDAEERHWERRWLFQWRARREASAFGALVEWARAEEEYGARDEAAAVLRRALDAAPEREKSAVALKLAETLRALGRTADAIDLVAPLLARAPRVDDAHAMARRMLADEATREACIERLEAFARARGAHEDGARVTAFLVEAREETLGRLDARRRWLRALLASAGGAERVSLAVLVRSAVDLPEERDVWAAAERVGRARGELADVARAYGEALAGAVDGALAEDLGKRLVALEGECAVESPFFVEALERVLAHAPGARWALDRVKLAIGAQGRWDALFRLYDRAIAASDPRARAELYDEAAFAARDLANDAERAIVYLSAIHAMRPDDAAIATSLERLYEREGRRHELIALLAARAERSEGGARRDLERRVAAHWLDLGRAREAWRALDAMIARGADVGELTDLLERVARAPGQARAVERLSAYYESAGRASDAVRVVGAAIAPADDPAERAARVRELVRLRVRAAQGEAGVFARVMPSVDADMERDASLAEIGWRAALGHATFAMKRAATDAEHADAVEGAAFAIDRLAALFLASDDAKGAARLLVRGARLLDPRRRRALLDRAARLYVEHLDDGARAMRIFAEIFQENGADDVAAAHLDEYAALLDGAGEHAKLAALWEQQAELRAGTEACAAWERAAGIWEELGAWDHAIAAYDHGAALGAERSFEALARIHASRGEWGEAAAALEWLCARSAADALGGRAVRLADAYVALGQAARARECLEALVASEAGGGEARARLMGIYRAEGSWRKLADLLSAEALLVDDATTKVTLLVDAASIFEAHLDEPAAAAAHLERAIAAEPRDRRPRPKLAAIVEAQGGAWGRVAELLGAQVELYGEQRSKERALVHHRLAGALARVGRAADQLANLRAAAKMHPTHAGILRDLGGAAVDAGDFDLAERTYRSLLLALRHPADGGGAPVSRTGVFLDLSAIALKKGDELRAVNLLDSALDAALESAEDPTPVERALVDLGRHDLAVRGMEWRVAHAPDATARAAALDDLARAWGEHLGRGEELEARIRAHADALTGDVARAPGVDAAAWDALWAVRAALGDDAALAELARRRIEARAWSSAFLADAAAFCAKAGDVELAPRLAAALGGMDAGAERARLRASLARTLIGQTSQRAVAVALVDGALAEAPADAAEIVDAAWTVARALEADRPTDAARVYEAIIDLRPADADAVRALTARLDALGSARLADGLELLVERDAASARAVAPRLVALRDEQADRDGLVRALHLGLAGEPARAAYVDRLLAIFEEDWDWPAITRVLRRAVDAAPEDRALFRRLVEAYRAAGAEDEALRLLDGALERRPGDEELLGLRARAREAAGDDDGAARDLRQLAESPGNAESVLAVLEKLEARAAGAAREELALFRVDVLARAGRADDARRDAEALAARSPRAVGALERVAALAAARGDWDAAAEARGRIARVLEETAGADGTRVADAVVAFADAAQRAGRPGDARDALERARAARPDDAEIARRLERVCESTADCRRLAELLAARAERADGAERTKLLLRAAVLRVDDGDAQGALACLERARAAEPENVDIALEHARVHGALGDKRGALAPLTEVIERHRGRRSPQVAAAYFALGKAHLALDELVEALDALKAAFAIDLRNGALALLLGLVALDVGDEKTAERALLAAATLPQRKDASSAGASRAEKASALYHLAAGAYAKGETVKARQWAFKALAEDRTHALAQALVERIDAPVAMKRAHGR